MQLFNPTPPDKRIGQLLSTGPLNGGTITINADTTKFNISGGYGYIVDSHSDPRNPLVQEISWSTQTGLTDTYLTTNLDTQILIDNNGSITQLNTLPTTSQLRDYIYLGKTVHTNLSTINATVNAPRVKYNVALQINDLQSAIGIINVDGNIISANGTNLAFNRSSGITYRPGANYTADHKVPDFISNTGITPVSFQYRYRNGSGGFTTSSMTTGLVPGLYDDGDGTLASVGNTEWTIQHVYYFTIGTSYVVYGQTKYATLTEAVENVSVEEPIVDPQFNDASLRAHLVLKGNTTDLSNTTENKIVRGGRFNP